MGYKCTIRIVGPAWLRRMAGQQIWGLSWDFGAPIDLTGEVLPPKEARIYLNSAMDSARFIETLRHEMDHTYTEYKGRLFDDLKEKLFAE